MLVENGFRSQVSSMNKTAKIIRFRQPGPPEVLKVEEGFVREPNAGEVLLRVDALGLSRMDLLSREGSYFEQPVFPARIGYDVAGGIDAVGPEVRAVKPGDRVSPLPALCMQGDSPHVA